MFGKNLCQMFAKCYICIAAKYLTNICAHFLKGLLNLWFNSHSLKYHFQLPLGVSVCLFCLQVAMLCCFNVQICIPELVIQKAIQKTFWTWQFERHTLQIFKSKPWFNHTTITNYYWLTDPKFCMQCIGIFQRWQTKVNLSIPKCTMWYSQRHRVDA